MAVCLDEDERRVLTYGIPEWGGRAYCTEEFVIGMGFDSVAYLLRREPASIGCVGEGLPLSRQDWRRILLLTEVVFASDVLGSGFEWEVTTPLIDEGTIRFLRSIQRKLVHIR